MCIGWGKEGVKVGGSGGVVSALVMLNKIYSFSSLLPNSIVATIPTYSPEHGSTHNNCEKWLKTYNTLTYRNSLFFKGYLLYYTFRY